MNQVKKYEFLEHTADIKFKVYAKKLEGIFENTALAISEVLAGGEKVDAVSWKEVELKGDNERMLYDFIDELIFLLDSDGFLVANARARMEDGGMIVRVFGDDALAYKNLDHVKAATYSEMYIKESGKGWEAQVVVDV